MTTDRALLERQIADVEVSEFTLEGFHGRRHLQRRNRRIGTTVVGLALAVAAIGGAITVSSESRAISPAQPATRSHFVGDWSSIGVDGSPQTMSIEGIGPDRVRMVIRDDAATECASAAATLMGTGRLDADGKLVVTAEVTCEDGRADVRPALLSNIEFTHDPTTGELFGLMVDWRRQPPAARAPIEVPDGPSFVDLEPGTYYIDPDRNAASPLRVIYRVAAAGWSSWTGATKFTGDGHATLSITTIENLVRDGCRDHRPASPPIGPTVDDLATALANLAPFEVTAPPTDVTLFGYPGKHLELRVPALAVSGAGDDVRFTECTAGQLHSWIAEKSDGSFYGYNGEPGRTEQFWILDVNGTRLVFITMSSPTTPPQDLAELRAMLDSVQIQP